MSKTQKYIVLFALFIVPLLFYVYLSVSTYNFAKLPVLTKNVADIGAMDQTKTFSGKVSVVVFPGRDIEASKGELFNLNEKVYKKFYGYTVFQFVLIVPKGTEKNVDAMTEKLAPYTNMIKWNFVYADEQDIQLLHESFQTNDTLDENLHSSKAYIVDKELGLRGRNEDKDVKDGKLYGYNMRSVSELTKKMHDDVKVVIAEYKFALKKNNIEREI